MTQVDLGAAIGLSFKQIRKYEQGRNRIGAATLFRLARALEVGVEYFFDGLDDPRGMTDLPHREGRELARHFQAIATPRRRRAFLRLVKAIADSPALQARWRDAG
ncbi:helix-turn-helix transcriptional regulator [Marivibrio halodurans]|uniref:Helix-turn-helix transcriptional regulator n=2 Tax=Marivibrio halodurans TaxID=2039722 RepID=A0A8J7S292_9PROT|nr:helix-turn-helix transcriptional regulator [Marivibrio halodurans]